MERLTILAEVMERALLMFSRQLEPNHLPSCTCVACAALHEAEALLPDLETLCAIVQARSRTAEGEPDGDFSELCRACGAIE